MDINLPKMREMRQFEVNRVIHWRLGVAEWMAQLGDLVIAFMLLAITLPLMVVVGLAIKLESSGPVLDGDAQIPNHGTGSTTANRAVGSNTDPCWSVSAADAY